MERFEQQIVEHSLTTSQDRFRVISMLNSFHQAHHLSLESLERLYTDSFLHQAWDLFYELYDHYREEIDRRRSTVRSILEIDPRAYYQLAQQQNEAIKNSRYSPEESRKMLNRLGIETDGEALFALEAGLGLSLERMVDRWLNDWSSGAIRSFAQTTASSLLIDVLARCLVKRGALDDFAFLRRNQLTMGEYGLEPELLAYIDGLKD